MIQALHFKDEKSDKFWFIETLDCELMVNYGKTGVTGKYEIKEFDTVEECEKEGIYFPPLTFIIYSSSKFFSSISLFSTHATSFLF